MRRIVLSLPEQAALESTFKTASDRRLRDRCQAVLMTSRGRKRTEIAQDLGSIAAPSSSGSSAITNEVWMVSKSSGLPARPGAFLKR
jgi:hypothetical protein